MVNETEVLAQYLHDGYIADATENNERVPGDDLHYVVGPLNHSHTLYWFEVVYSSPSTETFVIAVSPGPEVYMGSPEEFRQKFSSQFGNKGE